MVVDLHNTAVLIRFLRQGGKRADLARYVRRNLPRGLLCRSSPRLEDKRAGHRWGGKGQRVRRSEVRGRGQRLGELYEVPDLLVGAPRFELGSPSPPD
jgi:hypothetical protein